MRAAIEEGKRIEVTATETRPALQGARLTSFELQRDGIPVTLIADTMVGYVMQRGLVNKVIVGADRVMGTGDVFNKIGTYQIAVLAHEHGVPFYVAAPVSTFDLRAAPEDVVIEERDTKEITHISGKRVAPRGVAVLNPAFDRTPPKLVSAIVTEKGILWPPYRDSISQVVGNSAERPA